MRARHLPVRMFLVLPVLAALFACSGGEERPTVNLEVIDAIKGKVAEKRQPKVEKPPITRALLDTLDGAFMEAVLERNGQLAYLFVSAAYSEPEGHTLIVWRSEDNATLTMRNDVLIATRGIGDDLLSSDLTIDAGSPGPAGGGQRRMVFRSGEDRGIDLTMACEVSDEGPRTITIVERSHRTHLLRERCVGGGGEIVNEYWIDSANGLAWQTRQWTGPRTGYVRFRRLTKG